MKVILDIPDTEHGTKFLKRVKALSYVQKAKRITTAEINALEELYEAKKAHRLVDSIKAGRIQTRSARQLLNEL